MAYYFAGTRAVGAEPGETPLAWLPAKKHEITHSHLCDPPDDIAVIAVGETQVSMCIIRHSFQISIRW